MTLGIERIILKRTGEDDTRESRKLQYQAARMTLNKED